MTDQDDASGASSAAAGAGAAPVGDDAHLAALRADLEKWKDLAGRAQADLQNAKARIEREAADMRRFAAEQVIKRLLPTLDNFQRAFQHVPDALKGDEWVKGVTAIEQDLLKQLADAGLKRMQSLGEVADSARHEILAVAPGDEGKVVEVLEEGYEMHGRVIRPAKVKVGGGS
jgi:molecular chaperone GrpE